MFFKAIIVYMIFIVLFRIVSKINNPFTNDNIITSIRRNLIIVVQQSIIQSFRILFGTDFVWFIYFDPFTNWSLLFLPYFNPFFIFDWFSIFWLSGFAMFDDFSFAFFKGYSNSRTLRFINLLLYLVRIHKILYD